MKSLHRPLFQRQVLKRIALIATLFLAPSLASAEPWTINLKNADLREFITQVAAMTNKTFVVDQRANNSPVKVTIISSTPMGPDAVYELFLTVLRIHGYAAVPSGDTIKIVQQVLAKQSPNDRDFDEDARGEALVTQVIPIVNTESAELVKTLRPLLPQYGHMANLTTPNVLIINDHADNIRRFREIVKRIDVADNAAIEIYQLKEAWVEDIIGLLEQLAPEQIGKGAKGPNKVSIVASERTNSLIIRGDADDISNVVALIGDLDTPANRSGTIQVVRLAHSDAADLAEILKNITSENKAGDKSGQDVPVTIQADESINALVIKANPTDMMELREIISMLDVRRLQVLIEAAVVEVTTDFTRQLGTELAIADTSGSNFPIGLTAPSGTLASILQSLATNTTPTSLSTGDAPLIAAGKISETSTSFAGIIRALSANSDVDLLSTPSITTMDNEQAKIVAGQNVPFRTGSTTTTGSGTTNPFTTIERRDVGLTLEVTPHIHDGNLVRLEIHQEVSEVDPSSLNSIGPEGSSDLITNTRTIDTTVLADNQQVIILGGLIRDKTSNTSSRVPILGSIPGLGFLFRSTSKVTEKQNLLVFLRPTVLKDADAVERETTRKYSDVWEFEIEGKDPAEAISELFNGKR